MSIDLNLGEDKSWTRKSRLDGDDGYLYKDEGSHKVVAFLIVEKSKDFSQTYNGWSVSEESVRHATNKHAVKFIFADRESGDIYVYDTVDVRHAEEISSSMNTMKVPSVDDAEVYEGNYPGDGEYPSTLKT
jgi:hypothetical protein